jgi:protein gp37
MENTKIEWATHTFNPWEGCAKVSPGCKNCYAEGQHKLHHAALGKGDNPGTCWGVGAPRLGKSEDNWKKPLRWNREAAAAGVRARVFCASMADVFEPQSPLSASFVGKTGTVPTGEGRTRTVRFVDLNEERWRLFRLIYDTPYLDWLLLTKRPENIRPALEEVRRWAFGASEFGYFEWLCKWLEDGTPPKNVWLGTSVENQEQADIRVPQLLAAPAAVRFLSCEPLLGPVDLGFMLGHTLTKKPGSMFFEYDAWYDNTSYICENGHISGFKLKSEALGRDACLSCHGTLKAWKPGIDWVIVGGESGPRARAMHPLWAESLRDQCQAAGVAFHFKQWGEYEHFCMTFATEPTGEPTKFFVFPDGYAMRRVGKHEAGRLLDGRTWDELPTQKEVAP